MAQKPCIDKRKSIDQLYQEVKDFDLVLTLEPVLAEALVARLEKPVLGHFATTPRRLIYSEEGGEQFRQEVFLKLVEEHGMSWRQASYILQNVLDCWQNTGSLEKIKKYERFDGEEFETVFNVLEETENPFKAMEDHEIGTETDVAVIGLKDFNELDRKVLPEDYEEVELFTDEERELPEFKLFESSNQLIQSLKENVERVGPENTGIVVDPESPYQSLIESVFEAEETPFIDKTDLSEDNDLRTLINLVRIGLSRKNVRVKDVKPILEEMDYTVSKAEENMYINDTEGLEQFKEFLNVLQYLEFGEAVERYYSLTEKRLENVENLLNELNLLEETVSVEKVNDLEYFLDSFELTESETSEGVVIADPTNVSVIDRPVVFFIGMSSSWTRQVEQKPWLDREREEQKNLRGFTSLIQSGTQQIYMVQEMEMNQYITPCYHFNQALNTDFSNFADLPHTRYAPETEPGGDGFEKKSTVIDTRKVTTLSQSRLSSLALSPRLYYFEKLVSDAEDENIEKGNIFHDYAEFHINHPEFVESLEIQEILEVMIKHVKPYVEELELEKLETELKIGLQNIQEFLDSYEVEDRTYEQYEKHDGGNRFAEHYDKPVRSNITEMSFKDKELGAKGKVDLIMNKKHLVDYKSGRKYDAKNIVEGSNVELYEDVDWPDFQAIMYLTYLRKHVPGEKLRFTFLNFLHNMEDRINGKGSLNDNKVTVTYYPESFEEKITDLEMYEHLLKNSGKTSYQRKLLTKLGCPEFRKFFKNHEIEKPFSKEEIKSSKTAEKFKELGKEEVGDYKYVKKGCEQVLESLVEFRRSNYFKEDLDRFEEFLEQKIEELNRYKKEGFPLNAEPDDLPKRDMMLK